MTTDPAVACVCDRHPLGARLDDPACPVHHPRCSYCGLPAHGWWACPLCRENPVGNPAQRCSECQDDIADMAGQHVHTGACVRTFPDCDEAPPLTDELFQGHEA